MAFRVIALGASCSRLYSVRSIRSGLLRNASKSHNPAISRRYGLAIEVSYSPEYRSPLSRNVFVCTIQIKTKKRRNTDLLLGKQLLRSTHSKSNYPTACCKFFGCDHWTFRGWQGEGGKLKLEILEPERSRYIFLNPVWSSCLRSFNSLPVSCPCHPFATISNYTFHLLNFTDG